MKGNALGNERKRRLQRRSDVHRLARALHIVSRTVTSGNGHLQCAKIAPGSLMTTSCPVCGQSVPAEARFCGACGSQTSSVSENVGLVGTTIASRYRVLRVIAEGGMGIVYEAEQPMGEGARKVAIKTLLPELSRDPVVVSRFNRECSVVAGLEHPNTVRVYDFGATEEGTLYIAMEFVRGSPLGDVIAEGPMPLPRCLGIMEQMCSALEEAHDQGIVHRDLKPDNVVLCDRAGLRDLVKVLDFGIAKRSSEGGRHDTKLTQQGMVLGTPPYMSPEQFSSEALDRTSDVYSLAIIFYEMVNGRLPFEGDTPWQWAHQHMTVAPAPFTESAPLELQSVVMAALAKKPAERPATALQFFRRLIAASAANAVGLPGVVESRSRLPVPSHAAANRDALSPLAPGPISTEPSMFRGSGAPNTVDDESDSRVGFGSTVAPTGDHDPVALPVSSATEPGTPKIAMGVGAAAYPTHTEPSMLAMAATGAGDGTGTVLAAPRLLSGVAIGDMSSAHRVAAKAVHRATSVRRRFLISTAIGLVGVTLLAAGTAWWRHAQRISSEEPPRPSSIALSTSPTEIAAETPLPAVPRTVPPDPPRTAPMMYGTPRPAAAQPPATPEGPSPSPPSTGSTTVPAGPAANPAAPFPLPFPLALPSILTPPTLPPMVPPAAAPPAAPAPPPTPAPTPPAPAAGMQNCAQATALAATDLDAAVGQYQICEGAVGRAAAGSTKGQIATIGTARVRALAAQGKCDEALRIVQTLARIGVHRLAADAARKSGCHG